MRCRLAGASALLLALAWPWPLAAQSAAEALARGERFYGALEYDSAAAALRSSLARGAGLEAGARTRALVYLGATELFRDRRDSAAAAFRRLLLDDPRYRPDQLIFPPEVSTLFEQVRLGLRAVTPAVPAVTEIAGPGERLVTRLYATSYHEIVATVVREGGRALRTIYAGAIGDSLEVLWDGRDSAQVPADSGRYLLRVVSRGADGRPAGTVEVPLTITLRRPDTLPLPEPPAAHLLRPERAPGGSGLGALVAGLGSATAAVILPSLVGAADGASGIRFAVAGSLGAAAVVGFGSQRRPRAVPENIAANQALRLAWQRDVQRVRDQNAARLGQVALVIRASPPRRTSP